MSEAATEPRRCPRGHRIPAKAGRCDACWLEAGVEPPKLSEPDLPRQIGTYTLLSPLGRGAHGRVYRAHQRGGMEVALKIVEGGEAEREIKNLVQLIHPNIIEITDSSGLHEDPPYFAMRLMAGGSLRLRLKDRRWRDRFRRPERALGLMIPVAEAIQHAHRHRILHCDLKPANILLDADGVPRVSDFSVAKPLDATGSALGASAAGTYSYMSPEQLGAIDAPITTTSDVYGLGALLYELLKGSPPRQAKTPQELAASFEHEPNPAPIGLAWAWRDLEAVCLRALSRSPDDRYGSAALLAEDLKRVQCGESVSIRPRSVAERILRFTYQNPWLAASMLLGAVLLLAINGWTFNGGRQQQRELMQLVLDGNAALAKAQAQAALAELRTLRDVVLETSRVESARLESFLEGPAPLRDRPSVGVSISGFDNLFVADCEGRIHAYSSLSGALDRDVTLPPSYFDLTYAFRDYFRGAMALAARDARDVYIARAYRSTRDAHFYFAFSTPIYASSDRLEPCLPGSRAIGVLVASRSASSTLGHVQIPALADSGQGTALFGPRDRDEEGAALPNAAAFHAIVHDKLRRGDERAIDPELAVRLAERFGPAAPPGQQFTPAAAKPFTDAEYIDTVDDPRVRKLGGFFPVGRTGFVVAVASAYGKATGPIDSSETLLGLNLGFFAYCVLAFWLAFGRRAAGRVHPARGSGDAQ